MILITMNTALKIHIDSLSTQCCVYIEHQKHVTDENDCKTLRFPMLYLCIFSGAVRLKRI